MFPPLVGLSGVFDAAGFWQGLATMLSTAALWAQQRAHKAAPDPVEELMERLRHPMRHALQHPVVTLRRKADRRRAAGAE